jgi:PAS domain S-box-containing protein
MTTRPSEIEASSPISSEGARIITCDPCGKVTALTPSAEILTGWEEVQTIGTSILEVLPLIHTQSIQGIGPFIDQVLEHRNPIALPQPLILVTKDGTRRPVDTQIFPMKGEQQQVLGLMILLQDLVEKQDAEFARHKANQLSSISFLASGVAHDLNNLLTAILGNLSLVKSGSNPNDSVYQRLNETEKTVLSTQQVSLRLFKLSQEPHQAPTICDIKTLLSEAAEFAVSGSNVKCECEIAEDLMQVHVDESQITQVIYNLVINAQQAMPNGGTLHVKAHNESIPNTELGPDYSTPFIKVSITDSGIGIALEHLPRIFDPYFTTRKDGTGLGLAITDTIIRNHQGSTKVESTLGIGTTVSFYLPAIFQTPPINEMLKPIPPTRKGKILVLDDEQPVLNMILGMLESCGYSGVVTQTGSEAIRLFKEAIDFKEPFDACILDLTIPAGISGQETLQHLQGLNPTVKAILSSGHNYDPALPDNIAHGFVGTLPKPYTLPQLISVLESVLKDPHLTSS